MATTHHEALECKQSWNNDESKQVLPTHETEYYILWVKRLWEFAKRVKQKQATVGIWGAVPY